MRPGKRRATLDPVMVAVLEKGCGTEARSEALRILVVQSQEAGTISHADMAECFPRTFNLTAAPTLDGALRAVRCQRYDAILLDVDAATPHGATGVHELLAAAPGVPMLALVERGDPAWASQACELGVQDVILQQEVNPAVLMHAIRCAIGRKRHERRLADWAFIDQLTGLVNRRLFLDRLAHALARATRNDKRAAVLFIDLDNFKTVNDSFGHEAGDGVLRAVAQLLRGAVRQTDTVARFGGDEFLVLLEPLEEPGDAHGVAGKILRALGVPSLIPAAPFRVTASIGGALFPDHAAKGDALIRCADSAMLFAKRCGGNRYRLARARRGSAFSLAPKSYACGDPASTADCLSGAAELSTQEER
jgi:two-component system, cell cycle response regulator